MDFVGIKKMAVLKHINFRFQMKNKQKPMALACYICGRQFGTKSLEIHLKNCKEKFMNAQSAKEKKDRIVLPDEPALLKDLLAGNLSQAAEYNQEAINIHKYKVLPACQYCGRTFNQESLAVHEKVCSKENRKNTVSKNKQYEPSTDQIFKKPRTLVCCVCGRQFGLTSLKIHYPQCVEKFKTEQLKKIKKERREVPQFSPQQIEMMNQKEQWTLEEINAFNGKAAQNFKDKGMVHCLNCKRSFMPEPYKRHLKNCQLLNGKNVEAAKKKQDEMKLYQEAATIKKPKVLQCHICGRQFGLLSLLIHQKTCKTKFINNQQQKPRNERKPFPLMPENILKKFDFDQVQKWTVQQIEQYNRIANEVYRNESMIQCPFCHRKFIQQSFLKHKGYCQKQHQKQLEKSQLQLQQKERNQDNYKIKTKEQKVSEDEQQKPRKREKEINQSPFKSPSKIPGKVEPVNKQTKLKKIEENKEILPNQMEKIIHNDKPEKHIKEIHDKIQQMPEEFQQTKRIEEEEQQIEKPSISVLNSERQQKMTENPKQNQQKNQFLNQSKKNIQKQQQNNLPNKQIVSNNAIVSKQIKKQISFENQQKNKKQKPLNKEQKTNKHIQQQRSEQKESVRNQQQPNQQQQSLQLSQCNKCGRKFVSERLAKHQGICKGTKRQFTISKNKFSKALRSETDPPNPFKQQKDIANKMEVKKQLKINEEKVEIGNNDELAPMGHSKLLVPCNKCGRKFLENRVEKHQQTCKNKMVETKQKNEKINPVQPLVSQKKQKQKQTIEYTTKPIQQHPFEKDNIIVSGQEQYQQIADKDMRGCTKCGRKFKLDRIDIHQNVCKGPPAKKRSQVMQQKQLEKIKNTEIIKKTKQNFFTMVKEINSKKVKQQDIDRQLEMQLQTLQKQTPIRHINYKNRAQIKPTEVNNFRSIDQSPKRNVESQLQKVSTWKRKVPVKHEVYQTHLPGI